MQRKSMFFFLFCLFVLFCQRSYARHDAAYKKYPVLYQSGLASRYGEQHQGMRTAKGDKYDPLKLTAASNTLPLGTTVRVENPRTGRSILVKINDRGPFAKKRVIDLSDSAAKKLGIYQRGVAKVNIYVSNLKKSLIQG